MDSLGSGGAERLLLDYLPHLIDEGVEARMVALGVRDGNPMAARLEGLGVPVDLVPVRRMIDPVGFARVYRYLRQQGPDVVHTQLERADSVGAMAARAAGFPIVSTQHLLGEARGRSRAELRNALAERMLTASGAVIIAVSDAAKGSYERYTSLPASRVVTIRNGINIPRFREAMEDRHAMRGELGIAGDGPVLATVAVLRPGKGVEVMLSTLPALLQVFPDLTYVVAGDGSERVALEAQARQLGVADSVRFLGMRTDVARILSAADLFVHPTFADALPTTLAEAMAAGLPIVGSDVGGVPEMIIHERNGLLVPPGDADALQVAVDRILSDDVMAKRMSKHAEVVLRERFDLARQAEILARLYDAVIVERR